jgi:hypothetical protein
MTAAQQTTAEIAAEAVRAYKRRLRRVIDKAFSHSRDDGERFRYLLSQHLHTIYGEQRASAGTLAGRPVTPEERAVLDAAYDYRRARSVSWSPLFRWFEERAALEAFKRAATRLPDETV